MKYLTLEDYQSSLFSTHKDNENLETFIALAEQDLEIITFNYISNFDKLSITNQLYLKQILVQHTDFIIENYDYLNSIVDNYETLETKFQIGSHNIIQANGVIILKKLYVLLVQRGFINAKA
jgi:hypothetical protein